MFGKPLHWYPPCVVVLKSPLYFPHLSLAKVSSKSFMLKTQLSSSVFQPVGHCPVLQRAAKSQGVVELSVELPVGQPSRQLPQLPTRALPELSTWYFINKIDQFTIWLTEYRCRTPKRLHFSSFGASIVGFTLVDERKVTRPSSIRHTGTCINWIFHKL